MSYEHKSLFNAENYAFKYSGATEGDKAYPMVSYQQIGVKDYDDEIFYLKFEDCESQDDKEGFLLMCSEVELKELVNHLRMIRGV